MASTRAFNILEQTNENLSSGSFLENRNTFLSETTLPGKSELRTTSKLALKDLTNNASSRSAFSGKQQSSEVPSKKPLLQKSGSSSFLGKKSTEASTQQQPSTKKPSFPFTIFTPADAEYKWGKESCLREDLLEQMMDFHGAVYQRKVKPMKPLKVSNVLQDLPEFELPARTTVERPTRKVPAVQRDLPDYFLFSVPEPELPHLDFLD